MITNEERNNLVKELEAIDPEADDYEIKIKPFLAKLDKIIEEQETCNDCGRTDGYHPYECRSANWSLL